jgi:formate dehydrogenase
MKLAMAEVYEVATFYHHFDVVKEGEAAPPQLTVRVCDTLSCAMAGAQELLDKLPKLLGPNVRVIPAPCIGRCDQAPAVCIGQNAFGHADAEVIAKCVKEGKTKAPASHPHSFDDYVKQGGYKTWVECVKGERDVESVIKTMEDAGLRGLGGAGFPTGRKWRIVRAEPAPRLMAVNIDEGEPGTFKDRHYLERDPHRFLEGMLIAAWAVGIDDIYVYLRDEYHACRELLEREIAGAESESTREAPEHPPAPRRGRLHLRRRVRDDRIHRRQARHAAPSPAVRGAGRPLRASHARAQHGDAALGARPPRERRAVVLEARAQLAARGLRSFSVSGRVKKPGVHLAPAGITVKELIDEYCGGMQKGHELYAYLPAAPRAASCPRRWATFRSTLTRSSRTAASSARPRSSCCRSRQGARRGAEPDALLRARVVRPVHALPRRHAKAGAPDGSARVDRLARRALGRDGRRVDLRPRARRAPIHSLRREALRT